MIDYKSDWRFTNQNKYLINKAFKYKKYDIPYPEHSHCEFCWRKFGAGGDIQEGCTNEDNDRWICRDCFNNLKEMILKKIRSLSESEIVNIKKQYVIKRYGINI